MLERRDKEEGPGGVDDNTSFRSFQFFRGMRWIRLSKVKLLFLYIFYVLYVLFHYKPLSGDGGRVRPHSYVLR